MIDMIHERIAASRYYSPTNTYFLTTTNPLDDKLVDHFVARDWRYIRGDELNVFERFRQACRTLEPDYFFRICADNPFLSPELLDALGDRMGESFDYCSFKDPAGRPVIQTHYGFFGELINARTFVDLPINDIDKSTREHVTPIFYQNQGRFRLELQDMPEALVADDVRLTVDTQDDLEAVREIIRAVGRSATLEQVYEYLNKHDHLRAAMRLQMTRNAK